MNELIKRPHPALVHFPTGLFPASVIFLVFYAFQKNPGYLGASYLCFMTAAISILPVAVTGIMDYVRLKHHSDRQGDRLLKLHLGNGAFITVLSLIAGLYFFMQSPVDNSGLVTIYTVIAVILTGLVLAQGYIAALMIYQHRIGVDGETR